MEFEDQEGNYKNKNEGINREHTFSPRRIKNVANKLGSSRRKIIESLKNINIVVQWPHGRLAELFGNWIYDWGPRNYILKEIVSNIAYHIILNIENIARISRGKRNNDSDEEDTMKAEEGHVTKILDKKEC